MVLGRITRPKRRLSRVVRLLRNKEFAALTSAQFPNVFSQLLFRDLIVVLYPSFMSSSRIGFTRDSEQGLDMLTDSFLEIRFIHELTAAGK